MSRSVSVSVFGPHLSVFREGELVTLDVRKLAAVTLGRSAGAFVFQAFPDGQKYTLRLDLPESEEGARLIEELVNDSRNGKFD